MANILHFINSEHSFVASVENEYLSLLQHVSFFMIPLKGKRTQSIKNNSKNWVTVPPIREKTLSSAVVYRKKPKKINQVQKKEEKKVYPFLNSEISFTEDERGMMAYQESAISSVKLCKSPSRLQQLQSIAIEREREKSQVHVSQMIDQKKANKDKQSELEREDSYISIKFDAEDEYLRDKSLEHLASSSSDLLSDSMPMVTRDDIKKSVLEYADEHVEKDSLGTVTNVEGKFLEEDGQTVADIHPTSGMKKLRRIIKDSATNTDILGIITVDSVATPQQKQDEENLKGKIVNSHSGKKLRDYIYATDMKPPPFLADMTYRKNLPTLKP